MEVRGEGGATGSLPRELKPRQVKQWNKRYKTGAKGVGVGGGISRIFTAKCTVCDFPLSSFLSREDLNTQILDMLFFWAQQNEKSPNCIDKLISAMKESSRQDIADEIEAIIALGRQKYRESIRRVGLDQESSTEDSAIAMV